VNERRTDPVFHYDSVQCRVNPNVLFFYEHLVPRAGVTVTNIIDGYLVNVLPKVAHGECVYVCIYKLTRVRFAAR